MYWRAPVWSEVELRLLLLSKGIQTNRARLDRYSVPRMLLSSCMVRQRYFANTEAGEKTELALSPATRSDCVAITY